MGIKMKELKIRESEVLDLLNKYRGALSQGSKHVCCGQHPCE